MLHKVKEVINLSITELFPTIFTGLDRHTCLVVRGMLPCLFDIINCNTLEFLNQLILIIHVIASFIFFAKNRKKLDFRISSWCIENCIRKARKQLILFLFMIILFKTFFLQCLNLSWSYAIKNIINCLHCFLHKSLFRFYIT